jgi:hypothetical protein
MPSDGQVSMDDAKRAAERDRRREQIRLGLVELRQVGVALADAQARLPALARRVEEAVERVERALNLNEGSDDG